MCYALDDGPVQTWRADEDLPLFCPDELAQRIADGDVFMAHNAQFEYAIWSRIWSEQYGWPAIPLEQWYCTAAHAATLKLPRALEKAGDAAKVPIVKDKEGAKLIRLFCVPRKPTKKNPSVRLRPQDSPAEFDRFCWYCAQDVASERALHHKLPPMSKRETNVWRYDTRINERGLPIDTALVHRTLTVVDQLTKDIVERTRALTCTADHPDGIAPTQVAKLLAFMDEEEGMGLVNLQRKYIEEVLGNSVLTPKVDEILELRLEAARVSTKKLISMLTVCGTDSRARGTLLYHGAGTGRWAGKLIQPHNFVRGTYRQSQRDLVVQLLEQYGADELRLLFDRPMEAISNVMRAFICAPDGRVLFVADYSAIEARVVVWLAGQEDVLRVYRAGRDIYIWMAAQIFGVPEDSIDEETLEGFEMRRTGKHVVLGCGYGMAAPKFVITCKEVGGFDIPEALAQLGVSTYRKRHDRVVALWREVEKAAIACVRTGQAQTCANGRIGFRMWYGDDEDFSFLFMRLPSGRELAYPYPMLVPGKYGDQLSYVTEHEKTHQWWRETTYGGKLVENAVQAIARDIMLVGMVNAEKHGYEVVSTVHDEIISERDAGTGDLKEYERLVSMLPPWAAGCPVTAKGFVAKRWKKG